VTSEPTAAPSRLDKMIAARRWLFATFPAALNLAYRPLSVGVHQDVFLFKPNDVPTSAIRHAIRSFVSQTPYLQAVAASDAIRSDIFGEPVDLVSDQDRDFAAAALAAKEKRRPDLQERRPPNFRLRDVSSDVNVADPRQTSSEENRLHDHSMRCDRPS
jgi:sRNA-binding protein